MPNRHQNLESALQILAEDAAHQIQWLESQEVPVPVDELALNFDDIAVTRDDMLDCGELTKSEYEKVATVDEYLRAISGAHNAQYWTTEALENSEQWRTVRDLARQALIAFRHKV